MSQERETNLALFIDFDNVALGARDAGQRFDIKLLIQRILEKGKIIVKKAYADWHFYKEHMSPLHEAAIELIEIPRVYDCGVPDPVYVLLLRKTRTKFPYGLNFRVENPATARRQP